jgi:hypothetical protein
LNSHRKNKKFQVNKPVVTPVVVQSKPKEEIMDIEIQRTDIEGHPEVENPSHKEYLNWISERLPAMTEIVTMQRSVNAAFNPNWIQDGLAHRQVNFLSAILDELFETFRSANDFKFWAPRWTEAEAQANANNVGVELIDILHFAVSEQIILSSEGSPITDSEIAEKILRQAAWAYEDNLPLSPKYRGVSSIMYHMGNYLSSIGKAVNKAENNPPILNFSLDWKEFFHLCWANGMSFELVCGMYFAKATLNKFRKANNYKNGTWTPGEKFDGSKYIKNWVDGREDNAHLMEFLKTFAEQHSRAPTISEIQAFLEESYRSVKESVLRSFN